MFRTTFIGMRLNTFTDYSLRVLMYLGTRTGRLATIGEIAVAHGISENHLMKVVQELSRCEYVETVRGRSGGMRLAKQPEDIVVGDVVRRTEADLALAECFTPTSLCRIQPACQLKGILEEALAAMFLVLDSYTLADLLIQPAAFPWLGGDYPVQPMRHEPKG